MFFLCKVRNFGNHYLSAPENKAPGIKTKEHVLAVPKSPGSVATDRKLKVESFRTKQSKDQIWKEDLPRAEVCNTYTTITFLVFCKDRICR